MALGSVQRVGLRPLSLIRVPITASFSMDGHVVVAYLPSLEGWVETYTAGFTYQR